MAERKRILIQSRWRTYSHNSHISDYLPMIFGTHLQEALVFVLVVSFFHLQHIGRVILCHPTDSVFLYFSTTIKVKLLLQPFPV